MKRTTNYVQCELTRFSAGSRVRSVSYIPIEFARLGKFLKIKDSFDRWIDGWVVTYVGQEAVEAKNAPDYRKAIRRHRSTTGDSLPRFNET